MPVERYGAGFCYAGEQRRIDSGTVYEVRLGGPNPTLL